MGAIRSSIIKGQFFKLSIALIIAASTTFAKAQNTGKAIGLETDSTMIIGSDMMIDTASVVRKKDSKVSRKTKPKSGKQQAAEAAAAAKEAVDYHYVEPKEKSRRKKNSAKR